MTAARSISSATGDDIHKLVGRFRRARFQGAARLFVERPRAMGGGYAIGTTEAAEVVHGGIDAGVVDVLDSFGVEKKKLLASIGIDKTTLTRRKGAKKRLEPAQAEGLLRVMELALLATETFGTTERAAGWLGAAHPLLDGMSPVEYANSAYGLARVKSMLAAIRYGGVV